MDYNQWAKSVNFGAHYVPPTPPASGHYFDASVYTKSKKQNLSIMKLFKRLLGFFLFTLTLASCSTYINVAGEGSRCKVPAPRKFERTKVFPTRSHPMYRMGVH